MPSAKQINRIRRTRPFFAKTNLKASVEGLERRCMLAGDLVFASPVEYPTFGDFSQMVVAGDLDNDGDQDLVVANSGDEKGDVSVLLNQGKGTFDNSVKYAAGRHSENVAIADFNGDNNLDLAVTGFDSPVVSVLLGVGDGTFSTPVDVKSRSPFGVAVADLNSDGNIDLVTAMNGRSVSVVLGAGSQEGEWLGFEEPVLYSTTSSMVDKMASVADFDGDGTLDIGAVTQNGRIEVFVGSGDGTFTRSDIRSSAGSSPREGVTGDLNGDGETDLLLKLGGGRGISAVLNGGRTDGQWNGFNSPKVVPGFRPSGVSLGDLDGDGILDVAASRRPDNDVVVSVRLESDSLLQNR